MHVFVTGATGFVGSAVVRELLTAGHQVTGLARSDTAAAALKAAGADVHRGDLEDRASLRSGAAAADAVIHTGFNHDFSRFAENCAIDRQAIEEMGRAIEGSARPMIVTAGAALLAPGRFATEADAPPTASESYPRASEDAAAELAARGVNVSVVRLPPSVHGLGDHGFVPILIDLARQTGMSAYIGDGDNRWSAVHRFDAARLFRLAIEHDAMDGPYHAVAEEAVAFRDIAAIIGRRLNLPVVALSEAVAAEHFGWFTLFAGMDAAASSARTRDFLNWIPQECTLLADIDRAEYFPD